MCKKQINDQRRNFGNGINNQRFAVFLSRSHMKQTKSITWRTGELSRQKFNLDAGVPMSPNIESQKKADLIKTPKTAMDGANH